MVMVVFVCECYFQYKLKCYEKCLWLFITSVYYTIIYRHMTFTLGLVGSEKVLVHHHYHIFTSPKVWAQYYYDFVHSASCPNLIKF